MNNLLYTDPMLITWLMLAGAALVGLIIGAMAFIPIGRLIQRNREPEAWNRERSMERKYYELDALYNKTLAKLKVIKMALEE